jgi:hypothetical protein
MVGTLSSSETWQRRTVGLQAGYYIVTGLWPVVHLASFEAVTGPKVDDWLVHTIGLLATAIGAALAVAVVRRRTQSAEVVTLSAASAAAFAAIDLRYALPGRIPPIYLADAAVELAILIGVLGWRRWSGGR